MNDNSLILACSKCGAKNRVPRSRIDEAPKWPDHCQKNNWNRRLQEFFDDKNQEFIQWLNFQWKICRK